MMQKNLISIFRKEKIEVEEIRIIKSSAPVDWKVAFKKRPSDIEEAWKNMPKFDCKPKNVYTQILFSFASKEDLEDFCKLIGQQLTEKTHWAWHPKQNESVRKYLRFIDNGV